MPHRSGPDTYPAESNQFLASRRSPATGTAFEGSLIRGYINASPSPPLKNIDPDSIVLLYNQLDAMFKFVADFPLSSYFLTEIYLPKKPSHNGQLFVRIAILCYTIPVFS
jgi:hypothetical protein